MNSYKKYHLDIGHEGNSVSLNHVKDNWYMFVVSDHYYDNHIGLFIHRDNIAQLAKFFQDCYSEELAFDSVDD